MEQKDSKKRILKKILSEKKRRQKELMRLKSSDIEDEQIKKAIKNQIKNINKLDKLLKTEFNLDISKQSNSKISTQIASSTHSEKITHPLNSYYKKVGIRSISKNIPTGRDWKRLKTGK